VDLRDARVRKGGIGQAAFEVGVDGRRGELGCEGGRVLGLGGVFARVVDELVDGGLGAVRVVAV
jgi:hypothetical protein